ncbi:scavenger receptor class F member 2 precursor [Corchorus olitorius]|uniref:Scavenger receptor class F member 2 n=1 Tax=Corchorus olitorius TaxID=93759 RepID=A0A1R3KPA3_9ROSI|nr:scavenger receptor class F member 2 precursor [Corchorus olitorius]
MVVLDSFARGFDTTHALARLDVPPRPERPNDAVRPSRTGSQQAETSQNAAANLSPNFVPNVSANFVPPGPITREAAGASVTEARNPTTTQVMHHMFLVQLAFVRVMEREILLLIPIIPRRLIAIN